MSKGRLEEITKMVNTFDEDAFAATLYGYEMDSKALISDFVFLLNHIKNQQAEIDTLSMAHDEMHRLIDRDKHFLIKSNINLNRKVQELELSKDLLADEVTHLDDLLFELKGDVEMHEKVADWGVVDD